MARRVAERGEVDLAVSGLKPDWPPTTATAGIAPAGAVRRIVSLQQESGYRPQQAEHATFCRPAEGLGFGRTRIGLQTGGFLGTADDRPAASPESVRPDADAQADCAHKKGLANAGLCESG